MQSEAFSRMMIETYDIYALFIVAWLTVISYYFVCTISTILCNMVFCRNCKQAIDTLAKKHPTEVLKALENTNYQKISTKDKSFIKRILMKISCKIGWHWPSFDPRSMKVDTLSGIVTFTTKCNCGRKCVIDTSSSKVKFETEKSS